MRRNAICVTFLTTTKSKIVVSEVITLDGDQLSLPSHHWDQLNCSKLRPVPGPQMHRTNLLPFSTKATGATWMMRNEKFTRKKWRRASSSETVNLDKALTFPLPQSYGQDLKDIKDLRSLKGGNPCVTVQRESVSFDQQRHSTAASQKRLQFRTK